MGRVSTIAGGRYAKATVLKGRKAKTSGGFTRDNLMKNKRGKVVSRKAAAQGKEAFRNIQDWVSSVVAARKALQVSGFLAINGKSLQGKELYVKSKALRAAGRGEEHAPATKIAPSQPVTIREPVACGMRSTENLLHA